VPLLPKERQQYKFDNWDFFPEPATSSWPVAKFVVITREISAKSISYDFHIGFFDVSTGVTYGKDIHIKWKP